MPPPPGGTITSMSEDSSASYENRMLNEGLRCAMTLGDMDPRRTSQKSCDIPPCSVSASCAFVRTFVPCIITHRSIMLKPTALSSGPLR